MGHVQRLVRHHVDIAVQQHVSQHFALLAGQLQRRVVQRLLQQQAHLLHTAVAGQAGTTFAGRALVEGKVNNYNEKEERMRGGGGGGGGGGSGGGGGGGDDVHLMQTAVVHRVGAMLLGWTLTVINILRPFQFLLIIITSVPSLSTSVTITIILMIKLMLMKIVITQ